MYQTWDYWGKSKSQVGFWEMGMGCKGSLSGSPAASRNFFGYVGMILFYSQKVLRILPVIGGGSLGAFHLTPMKTS